MDPNSNSSPATGAAEMLHKIEENWKDQRRKLQEWKWHQIEIGNFKEFSLTLIAGWIFVFGLFILPVVDTILDAILIHQMASERIHLQDSVRHNATGEFCSVNATSSTIVYNSRSGSILPCDTVIGALLLMALIYAFFSLVSFLFTAYDFWHGYQIVKSNDVSDSFIDVTANQIISVFRYGSFCFFKAVAKHEELADMMVLYVYQTLRSGKQLLCDIPHFIIALMFSFLINQLDANDITNRSTATTIIKIVLLGYRILALIVCLVLYPVMRFCYVHSQLQVYTSFRFEKRIDLALWGQKNKFSGLNGPPPQGTEMQVQVASATVTYDTSIAPPQSPPMVQSPPPPQDPNLYPALAPDPNYYAHPPAQPYYPNPAAPADYNNPGVVPPGYPPADPNAGFYPPPPQTYY